MKKLLILLPVLLMACTQPVAVPDTAETVVFHLKVDYAAALVLETKYDNLPDCATTTLPLCSKSSIKKALRKASGIANSAINDAEYAVRTPGFSESKIVAEIATAKALTKQFVDKTIPLKVK